MGMVREAVRNSAYLRAFLLCASVICAAIALHHFWTVYPSKPDAGRAGMATSTLRLISAFPDSTFDISESEAPLGYVKRVTDLVHLTTYHCNPKNYQLSLLERLSLRLSGSPTTFDQGILVKHRFGCGFCHQRAFLVHQAIGRNGLDSIVFGLNGHVVVKVTIEDKEYLTDPDYGVGPFAYTADVTALDADVRRSYATAPSANLDLISGIYTTLENNGPYAAKTLESIYESQATIFWQARIGAYVLLLISGLCLWGMRFSKRIGSFPSEASSSRQRCIRRRGFYRPSSAAVRTSAEPFVMRVHHACAASSTGTHMNFAAPVGLLPIPCAMHVAMTALRSPSFA